MFTRLALVTLVATCSVVLSAHANFQWLRPVLYDCNPPGLDGFQVWRIYAEFNNPGDRLLSVFGNSSSPLTITSPNEFYQDPYGGNTAPDADAVIKSPTALWDTFCTIGLAIDANANDQTITSPGFPPLPVINHTNMYWLVPNIFADQGAPDASGRVLVLQATIPDQTGFQVEVKVGLTYDLAGPGGMQQQFNVSPILLAMRAGDLNRDFFVDVDDLLMVIDDWGQTGPGIADPTDDGQVGTDDLLLIINQWGSSTQLCWN